MGRPQLQDIDGESAHEGAYGKDVDSFSHGRSAQLFSSMRRKQGGNSDDWFDKELYSPYCQSRHVQGRRETLMKPQWSSLRLDFLNRNYRLDDPSIQDRVRYCEYWRCAHSKFCPVRSYLANPQRLHLPHHRITLLRSLMASALQN